MDRNVATDLLGRLHREQNAFYPGDDDTGLRAPLSENIVWHVPATIGDVSHAWSTVGLYRIQGGRIAECRLLPLDPVTAERVRHIPTASTTPPCARSTSR